MPQWRGRRHDVPHPKKSLGRYDEAIACYDMVLRMQIYHTDALNNRGVACAALGRYEEAVTCFDRVLRVQPRYLTALHNKGRALARLGKHEEAITCYDEVLRVYPDSAGYAEQQGGSP